MLAKKLSLFSIASVLALSFAAQAKENKPELSPVSIVLQWDHQSQFAGYYLALDMGFYAKEGLDVDIIRGGPDVRTCEMVADGEAQFCTSMLATALEKRENGLPLVEIAQVVNRSNFEIIAWKNPPGENRAPILRPEQLQGCRLTSWEEDFRLPFQMFLDARNIQVEILPQYYTLSLFINHGSDACSAMHYNEYHWLLQHGVNPDDLTVFPLWQYGVDLPEDGIYTTEAMLAKNPEICRAFVRASLEGWKYAKAHPEEALDTVMARVEKSQLPMNKPHMHWMLNEILTSIFPDENSLWTFGRLSQQSYLNACNLLKKEGAIHNTPEFTSFIKDEEVQDVEP